MSSLLKLYTTLAEWWPLLSPPDEYEQEAAEYWRILSAQVKPPIATMLELGSGGGSNAFFLKRHCRPTLTDLSPHMLAVSARLNPECEHVEGDMRTLRINREFDAVFIHDAIMYLTTPEELQSAIRTAFVHCRPGGAALFAPDCVRETFEPQTEHGGCDGAGRSLRWLSWTYDPDPHDQTYEAAHVYLMLEGDAPMRVDHEIHRWGVFSRGDWLRWLTDTGFEASVQADRWRSDLFVARRPELPRD